MFENKITFCNISIKKILRKNFSQKIDPIFFLQVDLVNFCQLPFADVGAKTFARLARHRDLFYLGLSKSYLYPINNSQEAVLLLK